MVETRHVKRPLKPGCEPECPGCAHKYLTPDQSLTQKENWLKNRLSNWAEKLETIRTVDENARWEYRDKVCLSTRWKLDKWQFGLMKKEAVIPIHDCPVHTCRIRDAVSLFSARLPADNFFPMAYYVQTGRHITLVVKSNKMPDTQWLDESLTGSLKQIGINGLWLHLNPCTGKKIFAKNTWHLLYGSRRSVDENGFIYGPKAFQQLIPVLYTQALSSAESFLSPMADDIFIDLYCGIGTGLARWQKRCRHVMGVESDGEATACARDNAVNAEILRGKCSDRVPQLIQWTDARPPGGKRLLYVNPPRTGLEPEVLEWIADLYKPDRMAYLSCSAGTLQRDLACLEKKGFEVIKITPYDFFPQTLHVETMVFLKSKK